MDPRTPVHVSAADTVTRFGITAQLTQSTLIELVPREAVGPDSVVVLAVDGLTEDAVHAARELKARGCERFVLVTGELDEHGLRATAEIGVCAVVERREVTPAALELVVLKATRGESALPTRMLSTLFRSLSDVDKTVVSGRGLPFHRLTDRETSVLRLVADGLDTDEIARELSYSSRTVKNILYAVTTRFCLRNRSHAVAYAMREGLI